MLDRQRLEVDHYVLIASGNGYGLELDWREAGFFGSHDPPPNQQTPWGLHRSTTEMRR
jgi:hypothetical protein